MKRKNKKQQKIDHDILGRIIVHNAKMTIEKAKM